MKNDFGERFDTARRFAGVSMSQGEVAADNDSNAVDGAETGTMRRGRTRGRAIPSGRCRRGWATWR